MNFKQTIMQKKYIKDLTENECIHTPTKEIYNQVCAKFNELGMKWYYGSSYIHLDSYKIFRTNTTLYPKKGKYGNIDYAKENNHTIYTINDLKDFEQVEKQIKLTSEQAKELYNLQPNLRGNLLSDFTDEELGIKPILKDWKDLDFKGSWFPNHVGCIYKDESGSSSHLNSPTEATAKMTFATAQLSMLLHDLPKGNKWAIVRYDDELEVRAIHSEDKMYYPITFQDENLADAFLAKHERLIKDYHLMP